MTYNLGLDVNNQLYYPSFMEYKRFDVNKLTVITEYEIIE